MQQNHQPPSVLAVLVTRNSDSWLRRVLASLAGQTHRRLGVLGVDNASTDRSGELLERALGPRRVIRLDRDDGFPAAVRRALDVPAAGEADFILLLHDDVMLAPDAVERMIEATTRLSDVAVVGPKVLDWEHPRELREVGWSADRFGYPHSPLEEGELDQGQYDAPREVLSVSTATMLVSREAWSRVGLPDDRLTPADGDLEFCWRVRLAGFRVMVSPAAVVHHLAASRSEQRPGAPAPRRRYRIERTALVSILTNDRLVTLLWVLPLYAVQGVGRFVVYLLTRRFDRAGEVMSAWGWNVVHLPGTVRRRFRAQALRQVPDRDVGRFLSPATARLTRWGQQASALILGRRTARVEEGDELEAPPLPRRLASVVTAHPVAIAMIAASIFTLVAFRSVLFVPGIEGGVLPVFPDSSTQFFEALASPWRTSGFGGPEMPSPALVPLGVAGFLTLGDPGLLARLMVTLTPLVAGMSCYAALRRLGSAPGPSVVGAICLAMSALVLWSASEGRITVSVLLAALPWLIARLTTAFGPGGPGRPFRWMVGTGMVLALALAFFPGIRLALGVILVPLVLLPERGGSRVRGVLLSVGAASAAAVLAFPLVAHLAEAGGGPSAVPAIPPSFASLARLSGGPAPGSGPAALFLPVAGVVGFILAEGSSRRLAGRSLVTAAGAIPLAWLAAAGYLPGPLANPVAYLAAAAVSLSFLVGLGAGALGWALRRTAFGARQVLGGVLAVVVMVGVAAQAVLGLLGSWAVGEDHLPPAWPVVSADTPNRPFRVLWLGRADGRPFPPPGGDPQGAMSPAPGSTVAYGVTGSRGRTVMATALPASGPPYEHLERVLVSILSGRIRHGGALLAPMGIRFVVAGEGRLPPAAAAALGSQVDLDLVQSAGGLSIFRNARPLPKAAAIPGPAAVEAAGSASLLAPLSLDPAAAVPLRRNGRSWAADPTEDPTLVLVADRFDPRWRAGPGVPFPAFGWGLGFEASSAPVDVAFDGGFRRPIELGTLAVLWLVALWLVRRTGREEKRLRAADEAVPVPAPAEEHAGSRA
jgi:GT2 family glycosyltransferase